MVTGFLSDHLKTLSISLETSYTNKIMKHLCFKKLSGIKWKSLSYNMLYVFIFFSIVPSLEKVEEKHFLQKDSFFVSSLFLQTLPCLNPILLFSLWNKAHLRLKNELVNTLAPCKNKIKEPSICLLLSLDWKVMLFTFLFQYYLLLPHFLSFLAGLFWGFRRWPRTVIVVARRGSLENVLEVFGKL